MDPVKLNRKAISRASNVVRKQDKYSVVSFFRIVRVIAIILLSIPAAIALAQAPQVERTAKTESRFNLGEPFDINPLAKSFVQNTRNTIPSSPQKVVQNVAAPSLKERFTRVELTQQRMLEKLLQSEPSTITRPTTFSVWTSILLGSVAVIITALGVGLAFFTFFGYRETIRRSEELAIEKSVETARDEIIKRIERGDFKKEIEEAIDRIAFKNIRDPDEDSENE